MKSTASDPRFVKVRPFKVWSNSFYLAPFIIAIYYGLFITAVLCLCVGIFGTIYHMHHESKKYLLPDQLSSVLLIGTNIGLCFAGSFQAPYFWIAFLFLWLALFYNYYLERHGQYSLNHGLWHLYGSLITLFCIFTYAL